MKKQLGMILVVIALTVAVLAHVGAPPVAPHPSAHAQTEFVVTNNSGSTAGFLHVQSYTSFSGVPTAQPAACGVPTFSTGFEYREVIWPSPCVGPGESVTFDVPGNFVLLNYYWAPSPPVVSAVNNTQSAAFGLTIKAGWFFIGYVLVQNAPGCPNPSIDYPASGEIGLRWPSACVDPGEKVSVHLGTMHAVTSAPYNWNAPVGGTTTLAPDVDASALVQPDSAGLERNRALAVIAFALVALSLAGGLSWFAIQRRNV